MSPFPAVTGSNTLAVIKVKDGFRVRTRHPPRNLLTPDGVGDDLWGWYVPPLQVTIVFAVDLAPSPHKCNNTGY